MKHVSDLKEKKEEELKTILLVPEGSSVKTSRKHSRQSLQMSKFVDHEKWESL